MGNGSIPASPNSIVSSSPPAAGGGGGNGILEKLMLLRRKQQQQQQATSIASASSSANDENEADRINGGSSDSDVKQMMSKSLPTSPLNKLEQSQQQELLLAAARTAVANAAARFSPFSPLGGGPGGGVGPGGPLASGGPGGQPLPPVPMFSNLPLPPASPAAAAGATGVKDEGGGVVAGEAGKNGNPPGHGTSAGFCNICHKFVSNRTNHKYVHSQVKFRCKICGYLYSRKDTLKDHIRGKHSARFSNADLNALVEVVPAATNVAKAAAAAMAMAAAASLESAAAARRTT